MTKSERLSRLNELAHIDTRDNDALNLCNEYAADNAKLLALLEECEGALNLLVRHSDKGLGAIAPDDHPVNVAWALLTKLRAAGIGGK